MKAIYTAGIKRWFTREWKDSTEMYRRTEAFKAKVGLVGTDVTKEWGILPSGDVDTDKIHALRVARTIAKACREGRVSCHDTEHSIWIEVRESLGYEALNELERRYNDRR